MTSLFPFRISIPADALRELNRRVTDTRWPDAVEDSGWDYGTDASYLNGLAEYWRNTFDWRAVEERLNELPQFLAVIDGLTVHFVHSKGTGPKPLPIVLTHGWPTTFAEMEQIVPLLTDPGNHGGDVADAFDVVVPSLPGFGFSERPRQRGMSALRTAVLWTKLMRDVLGYTRYAAHGSDIGASVTARIGFIDPDHVVGIHLTNVTGAAIIRFLGPGSIPLTTVEEEFVQKNSEWYEAEGAYSHLQRTKPQTLAYALNDSPMGLASWMTEKFRSWSDCNGDVELRFTKDQLLTQINLYWLTETIGSSMRMYFETRHDVWRLGLDDRVRVPTGVTLFPKDLSQPPREWGERVFNLHHWAVMPRGGHFPAHEEPELLAQEIRSFFRKFR